MAERRKKKKTKRWLKFLYLFIGFILGFVIFFGTRSPFRDTIVREVVGRNTLGNTCILLVGQDGIQPLRSDTIILACVNADRGEVLLFSIPRDSRLNVPGYGFDKVNHAYARGGISLLKETLEKSLGISIPYFVEVGYDGFEEVIDLLGGVEIEVEEDLRYTDRAQGLVIDIPAGKQVLDGEKALQYVRYRNNKLGDIGRIQRQQKFIQAIVDEVSDLSNITKAKEILSSINQALVTNMNIEDMVRFLIWFDGLEEKSVEFGLMPGESAYIEGVSYWEPDLDEARELIHTFFFGRDEVEN